MSESLQVALGVAAVVLAALFVGAVLPVLFEARSVLRQTRQFLDGAGRRMEEAMGETATAMATMNRIATDLDQGQKALKVALALGASLGPAVVAAIRAIQSAREEPHNDEEAEGTQKHQGSKGEK